jgi:hypothetical protein
MKTITPIAKSRLVFRKWSRKSYAVFASIKREVQIGHLSFSICESLVSRGKSFVSFDSRMMFSASTNKQQNLAESLRLTDLSSYLVVLGLASMTPAAIILDRHYK